MQKSPAAACNGFAKWVGRLAGDGFAKGARWGSAQRLAQDTWIAPRQDFTITLRHHRVGGERAVAGESGAQLDVPGTCGDQIDPLPAAFPRTSSARAAAAPSALAAVRRARL